MSAWRVQSDDRGAFDEIVVGKWLYIEMLSDREAYLRVGNKRWNVVLRGTHSRMIEIEPSSGTPSEEGPTP